MLITSLETFTVFIKNLNKYYLSEWIPECKNTKKLSFVRNTTMLIVSETCKMKSRGLPKYHATVRLYIEAHILKKQ